MKPFNMFKKKKINYKLIVKIGLLLLTVGLVVGFIRIANSVPKVKEAIVLATTVKPETFTELYFEDHSNLPKAIIRRKEYSFVFTIHNLENRDSDYPYTVYLQRDDQKTVIDSGSVFVRNNEYSSIEKTVGPLKNLRSKIVVELLNKNQLISFWMEEQNEKL